MVRRHGMSGVGSLFKETHEAAREEIAPGAFVLRGFALSMETAVLGALREVTAAAPVRNMVTPGGYRMSVAMTNCGTLGWVTERRGYRYDGWIRGAGRRGRRCGGLLGTWGRGGGGRGGCGSLVRLRGGPMGAT